ncbi:TetR/AcrR family transcriptional regulator [Kitasatospora sp. CB01950]|uniref:TetR/AcrR family transcriptional regulator n=1 Tax=Kitasatospora sp. CB01950 TaxID=1703930 RepID=UPI00093CA038|nr:ABC-F family ATP-binding cassette domain-containing protein [Kitasatospora sp. CB01950]OKI96775.1 TetR family transcriptional regulator [Kitasatospora sp. CB01950]
MTVARPTRIADAAIAVIAERGLRGLTHRAVDEAAGLPMGSTSNLARTRSALLEVALVRIAEVESASLVGDALTRPSEESGTPRRLLVDVIANGLDHALTAGRSLTVARIELALEAARRPELRSVYDRLGAGFQEVAVQLLRACGSAEPVADARRLMRWCEGVLFNGTAGAGHANPPRRAELAADADRYLTALLDR